LLTHYHVTKLNKQQLYAVLLIQCLTLLVYHLDRSGLIRQTYRKSLIAIQKDYTFDTFR